MLYGNESISHYSRSNLLVWLSMAFQAGFLNIGGFMACHRFVSHVTGFATYFGWEASQEGIHSAWGMLVVPSFFLLGAMVSGLLVDLPLRLHRRPRYYLAFGLIFALLLIVLEGGRLGAFGVFGEPLQNTRNYGLLILLCLVCGIQNGTITTVSRSVIRTTHLTGMTTDLGLGVIRVLNHRRLGDQVKDEGRANFLRLGLICAFGLGSLVGGFVFHRYGYDGFLLPVLTSGCLLGAMVYFRFSQRPKP